MSSVIVIPARYASTRLPGKPLVKIAGQMMIERVWRVARAVEGVDRVIVATDDTRIAEAVRAFGGEACMTPESCENGTERVYEAVKDSRPDIIINLQGDAPLTPPWFIQNLIDAMRADSSVRFATPAEQLSVKRLDAFRESKKITPASGTSVVFDPNFDALYFSKTILPFIRSNPMGDMSPVWRHIGIYGYRFDALKTYLSWAPSPLEQVEKLEQLRILENGEKIKIVPVDARGRSQCSVDSPEDVKRVEDIITHEGELLS